MKKAFVYIFSLAVMLFLLPGMTVKADTIYDSPYVSFSPDKKGWTVQKDDTAYIHYGEGVTVNTGISSKLRALEEGEHYYAAEKKGTVPVGKWVVRHKYAQCIHDVHMREHYLGLSFGRRNCYQYYNSGWMAYCADCGEEIKHMYVYMNRDAAETIDYMECGMDLDYYYLCPHCNNLEQGVPVEAHVCKGISANQYKVKYNPNDRWLQTDVKGFMSDSFHMYNNATTYEGRPVLPSTKLMRCTYYCEGYEFVGWNTKPDGSGQALKDEEAVWNLTAYDCNKDGERGEVILYAQWKPSDSTLYIDPNGGSYGGRKDTTAITQDYRTRYVVDDGLLTAPEGYTVSFETNGGFPVESVTGTRHFTEWVMVPTFNGTFKDGIYYFMASDGNVDILRADYAADAIILPEAKRENAIFGGWYFDEEFTRPAGAAGDKLVPPGDITLYAQWVELVLYSEENYIANGGMGAVDLRWEQPDNRNKSYKLYQSLDEQNWLPVHAALDIGNEISVTESFTVPVINKTYTVPYSGLYTLTAFGAQGEDYDSYNGGMGGMVSGTFWLCKGDILTYSVGGQDGTGGGGKAEAYGSGGGCTTVSSKEKGMLLIAGGGGGAGTLDGKPGGSQTALRTDGKGEGQKGDVGGGAGYIGGNNGEDGSEMTLPEMNSVVNYAYTGGVRNYAVPRTGVYRLEVWGAAGGDGINWHGAVMNGGRGGYSVGEVELKKGDVLYIGVGGSGAAGKAIWNRVDEDEDPIPIPNGYYYAAGGWNGGGSNGGNDRMYDSGSGGGGGATHIVLNANRGALSNYAAYRNEVLIVAGGGGGAMGGSGGDGYDGGGLVGGGPTTVATRGCEHSACNWSVLCTDVCDGAGGTQTRGGYPGYQDDTDKEDNGTIEHGYPGGFGYGASGSTGFSSGAGGGWYGGGSGGGSDEHARGGGGSGYLSSSILPGTGSMINGGATAGGAGKARITMVKLTEIAGGGGSNYVNTSQSINYDSKEGVQKGNGAFMIQSVELGFVDGMGLEGVAAPDLNAPAAVLTEGTEDGESAVTMEPVGNSGGSVIKISWAEPEDYGTTYYHVVDSHLIPTGSKLCTSNVVENTLVSGVKGYYYSVDTEPETVITNRNGLFTGREKAYTYLTLTDAIQYLHIATVDVAGNISETVHIPIPAGNCLEISWPIYTTPMRIEEGENVATAELPNTWYVRADGSTPYTLSFDAYTEGAATEGYQINQMIFESQPEEEEVSQNLVGIPIQGITEDAIIMEAEKLSFATEGASVLKNYLYTKVIRSDSCQSVSIEHRLLLEEKEQGKLIRITPRAAVLTDSYQVYSEPGNDRLHGMYIIGDGMAPEISGTDKLEELTVINRDREAFTLTIEAEDMLSGMAGLWVEIWNEDNGIREVYEGDENGQIIIDFLAEIPVFSGDFTVMVKAVDRVGNVAEKTYRLTEFALETEVSRILAPHEPVFQCGESGLLHVKTWGYVERIEVEFPEQLAEKNPRLNNIYTYEIPQYKREEEIQFMIPLYTPYSEDYKITVRAYKGERQLEEYPRINVIEVKGTILDEIRTRLR